MKILDCTLRDGGYYTNWDFDSDVVTAYIEACDQLPLDYIEVGYRSKPMKEYFGEMFYCPIYVLEKISRLTSKKIAIILNEKDVRAEDAAGLLLPVKEYVSTVRIAIAPTNFKRSIGLIEEIKKLGFEVCANVMYMSSWADESGFLNEVSAVDGMLKYFYMVDSYGGVFPEDVKRTIELVSSKTSTPLGFHGHNNLEMALINTITAIDNGVEIVDATMTGMGRGAGNLKTELLLSVLNSQGKLDFDYNALSKAVVPFSQLQEEFGWGTNLPYMVSGANSLPQKQVMEWVSKRYYSFNSIIRALSNQSKGLDDNQKLEKLDFSKLEKHSKVMVIGGGPSVNMHDTAIRSFLSKNEDVAIIHASSKNALAFQELKNQQYYCLVGNEGHRLEDVFHGNITIEGKCILPAYPRKMGTYIPNAVKDCSYELEAVTFADKYKDSHTALALQTAFELEAKTVYVVGYDGYSKENISEREQELFLENEYLFEKVNTNGAECVSLTTTKYSQLSPGSVFAEI